MSAVVAFPWFEFHPIANALRLMNKTEFDSLKASIKASGLNEPIWLYEGKILDGRNRYSACCELGVHVSTREFTGEDPIAFALAQRKERCHDTPSQLAVAATNLIPLFAEEARKRQATSTGGKAPQLRSGLTEAAGRDKEGKAIGHAANVVGVGATTVFKVARIKREHPERIKEIEDGHKTANAVHIELFEADKPRVPVADVAPKTEALERPMSASHFENVREAKEHRVTALQAIEKLLRDTEPVFRVGFWPLVNAQIDTVDSEKAAELQARAAKCRQQFSQLIQLLKGRAKSS